MGWENAYALWKKRLLISKKKWPVKHYAWKNSGFLGFSQHRLSIGLPPARNSCLGLGPRLSEMRHGVL